MTLHEIKQRLELTIPLLGSSTVRDINRAGNIYRTYENVNSVREAVKLLEPTDLFNDLISSLKATEYFALADRSIFAVSESDIINTLLERLLYNSTELFKILEKVIGIENPNTVYIKLPPIKDFDDLEKTSHAFQVILSQCITHESIGGTIRIEGVENGSVWVKVSLGTQAAVSLLAGIAWSAIVINKKYQETKYIEELVKQQHVKTEHLQDAQNVFKLYEDALYNLEVNHLYQEHFQNVPDKDSLITTGIKTSLKFLAEQIEKGAEVQPLLTAPEEVKNLFPDLKNLPSIQSKVKQIDNK